MVSNKVLVVYVAGPFRGPTQWDIVQNVRAAERYGLIVANYGAMPLIPHANTAHFHGQQTEQFWVEGTKELLRRCDGAIFIPGWRNSSGSRGEWDECGRLRIPHTSIEPSDPHEASRIGVFLHGLKHGQDHRSEEQSAAAPPAED